MTGPSIKTGEIFKATRSRGTCRSCSMPIEWAQMVKSGKRMPFDAPIVALRTRPDVQGRLVEEVDLATSHFVTCPDADQHRRPR